MKVYKLTNKDMRTRGGCQWELGVTRKVERYTGVECSGGVLHSYSDPLLTAFMDPSHGDYGASARLFEARTGKRHKAGTLKHVSEELTLVREIELPVITTEQRIEVAIRVAKLVCEDAKWNLWADKWLSGEDRSEASARAASAVAHATSAAAWAAADAAWAAAWAAADAAWAVVDAASAAAWAAADAAWAVVDAVDSNAKFTRRVVEILHEVVG